MKVMCVSWLVSVAAANFRAGQKKMCARGFWEPALWLKAYRDVAQKRERCSRPRRKVGQLLGQREAWREGRGIKQRRVQRKREGYFGRLWGIKVFVAMLLRCYQLSSSEEFWTYNIPTELALWVSVVTFGGKRWQKASFFQITVLKWLEFDLESWTSFACLWHCPNFICTITTSDNIIFSVVLWYKNTNCM